MEEDIEKIEKKVAKQSLAMELLDMSKEQNKQLERANKRLIGVILFILILLGLAIGYLVYVLNDIGTTKQEIEINDVETIDNSHIKIGDDVWERLD